MVMNQTTKKNKNSYYENRDPSFNEDNDDNKKFDKNNIFDFFFWFSNRNFQTFKLIENKNTLVIQNHCKISNKNEKIISRQRIDQTKQPHSYLMFKSNSPE